MSDCLHIAYATDDKYVMYVGISMYSLFENNDSFDDIIVHILCNGVSEQKKKQLYDIASEFGRTVLFYDCSKLDEWLGNDVSEMFRKNSTNVPITSYARLFLPNIVDKSISKMLYLDADSIVVGSYKQLWEASDNDKYVAMGVLDNVSEEAKVKIGLGADACYVNAGVLLMNLSLMRKNDFVKKSGAFIEKYRGSVFHHDQGVINGLLADSIGYLSPKYNMMSFMYETKKCDIAKKYGIKNYYSEEVVKDALSNPVFIHFTEGNLQRPWICGCKHPLKDRWIYYRDKTIWKDVPLSKDRRGIKLKCLAWMRLNLPDGLTNWILKVIKK